MDAVGKVSVALVVARSKRQNGDAFFRNCGGSGVFCFDAEGRDFKIAGVKIGRDTEAKQDGATRGAMVHPSAKASVVFRKNVFFFSWCLGQSRGNGRVPYFLCKKVDDGDARAVFDFKFAQFLQTRPPLRILLEVVRHALGKKNVPGVAAVHHPLGDVNARASDIGLFI